MRANCFRCSAILVRATCTCHYSTLQWLTSSPGYSDRLEVHLGHDERVSAMAASPDGRYIASGARNGTVIIWSGTTTPEMIPLEVQCPAESGSVLALHFSDSSEILTGRCEHDLLIWRVVDGVQLTSIPGFTVSVLRRTKTRTLQGCLADDFSLHVVLHGHTKRVQAVCISPCERYVATASEDCTVRLWSTKDGELLWTFREHDRDVTHVVFSPDRRFLASADMGGTVHIRLLAMFVRDVPVSSVDDT
ncbi:WD40 repeat-like protein [Polyporus arcularius HHB13444]|uniref:WD40 repeat-like protein n=1 Tax=Polyporus arcularius HHB13444 TaxID=1314778 RepID=A0A5C3PHC3_9APHY|nr:WD40 repeat-like protein [Polyporus arcularius HHB13444]